MNNSQLPVGMNDEIGLPPVPDIAAAGAAAAPTEAVIATAASAVAEGCIVCGAAQAQAEDGLVCENGHHEVVAVVEVPLAAEGPAVTKRRGRPRKAAAGAEAPGAVIEPVAVPAVAATWAAVETPTAVAEAAPTVSWEDVKRIGALTPGSIRVRLKLSFKWGDNHGAVDCATELPFVIDGPNEKAVEKVLKRWLKAWAAQLPDAQLPKQLDGGEGKSPASGDDAADDG